MKKFIGLVKFVSENKNLAIVHEIPLIPDLILDREVGVVVETTGGNVITTSGGETYTAPAAELTFEIEVPLKYDAVDPTNPPTTKQVDVILVQDSFQLWGKDEDNKDVIIGQVYPVATEAGRAALAEAGLQFTYKEGTLKTEDDVEYKDKHGIFIGDLLGKGAADELSNIDYTSGKANFYFNEEVTAAAKFNLNYFFTYTEPGGEDEFEFTLPLYVKEGSVQLVLGSSSSVLGKDYPVITGAAQALLDELKIDYTTELTGIKITILDQTITTDEGIFYGPYLDSTTAFGTVDYTTGDIEFATNYPIPFEEFVTCIYHRYILPKEDTNIYNLRLVRLDPADFPNATLLGYSLSLKKDYLIFYAYEDEEAKTIKRVKRISE